MTGAGVPSPAERAEAERWFRERLGSTGPQDRDDSDWARHAAVLVRAYLADRDRAEDDDQVPNDVARRWLRERDEARAVLAAARSVSPDAAPATTEREYRVVCTEESGHREVALAFGDVGLADLRDAFARPLAAGRMVMESRAVSPWAPVDEQDGAQA